MINGGNESARRVLRYSRLSTALGAAYLALAAVGFATEVLLGLRWLIVSFVVAAMLPVMLGGYFAVRANSAAEDLARSSGVAARTEAWFPMTFVCGLITIGGLAGVGALVRNDVVMTSTTVAVIDTCNGSGKGASCAYHWTVDGRTHSASNNRIKNRPTGDQVPLRYAPSDPSYALPVHGGVTPDWIASGGALLAGTLGLATNGRRERRAHREYLAAISALST